MKKELIQQIAVTWEICGGNPLSEPAKNAIISRLGNYKPELVSRALDQCTQEVKGRLALADIIQRIDDGRPGPEQAWSMIPQSEADSVVWTNEMAAAWGEVRELDGDRVAMRMAFLETYRRYVQEARSAGVEVNWTPSLGHDAARREGAILHAVRKGRLTQEQASEFLPEPLPINALPYSDVQKIVANVTKACDAAQIEKKKL